jgi:UDP-N-acetylglucosamine 2-epimerase (non-hydrolysing)
MSEVFKKLDEDPDVKHTMIHTGQHYDDMLSTVFFKGLELRNPDYNLCVGGGKHYEQTGKLSFAIINLFKEKMIDPDLIVFLGDSNSVCAALPLKKEGYKIAHIEAGMRSGDKRMLEEINRTVCDHCSDYHLVYHEDYKQNLIKEGLPEENIFVVGNTIVEPTAKVYFPSKEERSGILLDIHRPENFNDPERMRKILYFANNCLGQETKMVSWGRPYQAILDLFLPMGNIFKDPPYLEMDKISVVPLMSHKDFLKVQSRVRFIISDSGTAQEEAALLHTPVIVPRDFTERPQSVDAQCSYMLDVDSIDMSIGRDNHWGDAVDDAECWLTHWKGCSTKWLGDGFTSGRIVECLKSLS